jgi:excisionase family DNA binding protein
MTVQAQLFDFGDEPSNPDELERPPATGRQPTASQLRPPVSEPQAVERLLFKPEEAAAILGVGRTKFYELLASGAVASVHIGSARRVAMTALVDYVARLHAATGTSPAAVPRSERPVTPLRPVGEPQPTAREQQR